MMSYKAIICELKDVKKHQNANKLFLSNVSGYQVIVGLEEKEGDIGIFFPTDGRLTTSFASPNNLIRTTDENGNRSGGMFDENCRVRAQKFRGEISEGFWIPLSSLSKVEGIKQKTIESLKIGDQFDELDGVKLCEKYFPKKPKREQSLKGNKPKAKRKNPRFPEHLDTKHFRVEGSKIKKNSVIYLSEKLHGTSARYGYVLEGKEPTLFQRVLGKLGIKTKVKFEYVYLVGTRRVELNKREKNAKGFYGSDGFRHKVMDGIWEKLRKGEVLFGEIVGYTDSGAAIQSPGRIKATGDKGLLKKYGDLNHYSYGCVQGTCELYIYRISNVNEDGLQFDLPWPQVKKRCAQLGLRHVPDVTTSPFVLGENFEKLDSIVKYNTNGSSLLNESSIREGVCVRIENEDGMNILKEKSFAFRVMEENIKDDGNVDIEEQEELNKEENE
ncbi:MAG: RNA ligase family protein [Nanoarchaeota archaeon]|nr:RNA ligase family protein [Nanoarchaeota archaeon]